MGVCACERIKIVAKLVYPNSATEILQVSVFTTTQPFFLEYQINPMSA